MTTPQQITHDRQIAYSQRMARSFHRAWAICAAIALIAFVILSMSVYGQAKDTLYYSPLTGTWKKMPNYKITDTSFVVGVIMDTIHHDKKGDYTVICHGNKCDTVRNCIYEYQQIRKRVKKN